MKQKLNKLVSTASAIYTPIFKTIFTAVLLIVSLPVIFFLKLFNVQSGLLNKWDTKMEQIKETNEQYKKHIFNN